MSFEISWIFGPGNYSAAIRADRVDKINACFVVARGDFWIFGPGHYTGNVAREMQRREKARIAGSGSYLINTNRPGRADELNRVESDREISFVWEPGDAVVVRDDRDDGMSYRIGGNRKAGYTLYHCGARSPHHKTGMPLGVTAGPHPTLRDATRQLVFQFKSDWRYLNLDPVSGYRPYYGSSRGWELLYRRVCEARAAGPIERKRPKPRRVLPPHLRCRMARADAAAELAEELERAKKMAYAEDAAALDAERRFEKQFEYQYPKRGRRRP